MLWVIREELYLRENQDPRTKKRKSNRHKNKKENVIDDSEISEEICCEQQGTSLNDDGSSVESETLSFIKTDYHLFYVPNKKC